jgi:D-tyrosyl-tRNA(Tyr) deacylase
MRAVVQRVSEANVRVDAQEVARIGPGLLVLLGVAQGDGGQDVAYLADKVVNLRVFADDHGHMNRSLLEAGGALLVVSQFTLLGDARKGRRPGFTDAAPPEEAAALYRQFVARARQSGARVEEGVFRALMDVSLVNHGPVTLLLDSRKVF